MLVWKSTYDNLKESSDRKIKCLRDAADAQTEVLAKRDVEIAKLEEKLRAALNRPSGDTELVEKLQVTIGKRDRKILALKTDLRAALKNNHRGPDGKFVKAPK